MLLLNIIWFVCSQGEDRLITDARDSALKKILQTNVNKFVLASGPENAISTLIYKMRDIKELWNDHPLSSPSVVNKRCSKYYKYD